MLADKLHIEMKETERRLNLLRQVYKFQENWYIRGLIKFYETKLESYDVIDKGLYFT